MREMRRKQQALSKEECVEILDRGSSGVLALAGSENYPYAVPLNYVYWDNKIYFHGAKSGYKIDAVKMCDKASFCVIGQDDILPEKYTSCYRSAIVFGKIRILEEEEEKREAIRKLAAKYSPKEKEADRMKEVEKYWEALAMLELSVEHMTGKEGKELVRRKQENSFEPEA